MSKKLWKEKHDALIGAIVKLGYPAEFGHAIALELGGEKWMERMTVYLLNAQPRTMEEIVDEMVALKDLKQAWIDKKKSQYWQQKYNEMLFYGTNEFGDDEEHELADDFDEDELFDGEPETL